MYENEVNGKYSNVFVSGTTRIHSLNFNKFTNIVYINNVYDSDKNIITLSESNTTYLISYDINKLDNYRIYITSINKLDKDIFTSNNHNLKKGDLIKITINNNLSNEINNNYTMAERADITYKVINVTRNTFSVITSDTYIKNIVKQTIKNIPYKSSNNYVTKDIYTPSSLPLSLPSENENIEINIPSNNTDDLGITYNIIINDDNIKNIKISVLNNDTLEGKINIISNGISNNLIYTDSNKKYIKIDNIDYLLYSSFELIKISKNNWFINAFIYSNTKKLGRLIWDNTDKIFKYETNPVTEQIVFKHYIYELDIGHSSLREDTSNISSLKLIINSSEYKNVVKMGHYGIEGSIIKIYIDNNLDKNSKIRLKYHENNIIKYINLLIVKNTKQFFYI